MATMTAAIVARPVVVPFTLMKPQTPVPLRSFPVATAITESIAVLMDQKMTISGAAATRGAMADDGARIAPRETGVTEKAWAGVSARATSATTDKLDCIADAIADARSPTNERNVSQVSKLARLLSSVVMLVEGLFASWTTFPTHRSSLWTDAAAHPDCSART